MKVTVVSCCEKKFVDKQTNKQRIYYAVYLADASGAVGRLYCSKPCKPGEQVDLEMIVEKDMRMGLRIVS